ncbi:uncharacterized protein LOC132278669 [Cornus florida]|uniref:uncharacterized protein LOC132278669 n=1 Tax=Cornus florida TaxID=4283 RepID=UPI002897D0A7|nr:uncharacterized protein LOC132278669 [Cornus florida]
MMQTMNHHHCSNATKTAEIMSRFRPIAPKPEFPVNQVCENPSLSHHQINFRQPPYLSNVWSHLQTRPTRTRKRGRSSLASTTIKKPRTNTTTTRRLLPLAPIPPPPPPPPTPCSLNNPNTSSSFNTSFNNLSLLSSSHGLNTSSSLKNMSFLGSSHELNTSSSLNSLSLPGSSHGLNTSSSLNNMSLLGSSHGLRLGLGLGLGGPPKHPLPTLPAFTPFTPEYHAKAQARVRNRSKTGTQVRPQPNLITLPLLPFIPCLFDGETGVNGVDLNQEAEIPQERDFLWQIGGPTTSSNVIAPQPVRPVESSIRVGSICEDPNPNPIHAIRPPTKKREEVEEDVESEALPAVVSDSNNNVRMTNSAYKEMVGQPKCLWLGSCDGSGDACKRIGGEVTLRFSGSGVPVTASGFCCQVMIEWGSDEKKRTVIAFTDVVRLSCESKDYLFAWRFHTTRD